APPRSAGIHRGSKFAPLAGEPAVRSDGSGRDWLCFRTALRAWCRGRRRPISAARRLWSGLPTAPLVRGDLTAAVAQARLRRSKHLRYPGSQPLIRTRAEAREYAIEK